MDRTLSCTGHHAGRAKYREEEEFPEDFFLFNFH